MSNQPTATNNSDNHITYVPLSFYKSDINDRSLISTYFAVSKNEADKEDSPNLLWRDAKRFLIEKEHSVNVLYLSRPTILDFCMPITSEDKQIFIKFVMQDNKTGEIVEDFRSHKLAEVNNIKNLGFILHEPHKEEIHKTSYKLICCHSFHISMELKDPFNSPYIHAGLQHPQMNHIKLDIIDNSGERIKRYKIPEIVKPRKSNVTLYLPYHWDNAVFMIGECENLIRSLTADMEDCTKFIFVLELEGYRGPLTVSQRWNPPMILPKLTEIGISLRQTNTPFFLRPSIHLCNKNTVDKIPSMSPPSMAQNLSHE